MHFFLKLLVPKVVMFSRSVVWCNGLVRSQFRCGEESGPEGSGVNVNVFCVLMVLYCINYADLIGEKTVEPFGSEQASDKSLTLETESIGTSLNYFNDLGVLPDGVVW